VAGSKVFTARERQRALGPDDGFAAVGVRRGYPLLLAAGRELDRNGVRFVDLTEVFRDQTRNIYRDDCCHLTEPGCALLAERIGRAVASAPDRVW
jgi:hypothetical protein